MHSGRLGLRIVAKLPVLLCMCSLLSTMLFINCSRVSTTAVVVDCDDVHLILLAV